MPRPSTIEQLPPDILSRLQELLRDPRCTQLDAVARINEILEERGEDERISKSALGRYAVKMERVGERLRQSRAVAEMWIGKLGASPQGQLGHLINEMLRTLAFDLTLKLHDGEISTDDIPGTVESLKDLSLAVMRLEKAATDNIKREELIRSQERAAAADDAVQAARDTGLSDAAVDTIRRKILGIAA